MKMRRQGWEQNEKGRTGIKVSWEELEWKWVEKNGNENKKGRMEIKMRREEWE